MVEKTAELLSAIWQRTYRALCAKAYGLYRACEKGKGMEAIAVLHEKMQSVGSNIRGLNACQKKGDKAMELFAVMQQEDLSTFKVEMTTTSPMGGRPHQCL